MDCSQKGQCAGTCAEIDNSSETTQKKITFL